MSEGPREHIAVLPNLKAGRGLHRSEMVSALAALTATGREVRVLTADTAAAAALACHEAVAGGAAALVVIGGDGTVHLAIQALAGTGVPLGIVPAGTGNDFAMAIGVAPDLVRAAGGIADALTAGRTRAVDLARATGPDGYDAWFAAVLGAGFDAIVNERANRMRWPRGPRRYDIAIFGELVRLKARQYKIVMDGGLPVEVDAILVAVGNTRSYGGGMRITPAADPTDGLLDIIVGGALSRLTLMRLRPKLYSGSHVGHPLVTSYRARTVEIYADSIVAYADGERACALPITVAADPAALHVLV